MKMRSRPKHENHGIERVRLTNPGQEPTGNRTPQVGKTKTPAPIAANNESQ